MSTQNPSESKGVQIRANLIGELMNLLVLCCCFVRYSTAPIPTRAAAMTRGSTREDCVEHDLADVVRRVLVGPRVPHLEPMVKS